MPLLSKIDILLIHVNISFFNDVLTMFFNDVFGAWLSPMLMLNVPTTTLCLLCKELKFSGHQAATVLIWQLNKDREVPGQAAEDGRVTGALRGWVL